MVKKFHISQIVSSIILILVIVAASLYSLNTIREQIKNDVNNSLLAVLSSTDNAYKEWEKRKTSEIRVISKNKELLSLTKKILSLPRNRKELLRSNELKQIRSFLTPVMDEKDNIGIFIIARDSISLASWRNSNIGTKNFIFEKRGDLLSEVWKGNIKFIPPIPSDVELENFEGKLLKRMPTMFFAAPIVDENNKTIAIFTIRIDLRNDFSNIAETGSLGEDGETYLIDEEGWLITKSRYFGDNYISDLENQTVFSRLKVTEPHRPLNLDSLPFLNDISNELTFMARQLVKGENGYNLEGYKNYAGEEVIGAWKLSKELGLRIAVEVRKDAAFNSFSQIQMVVTVLIVFIIFFILSLVYLLFFFRKKLLTQLKKSNDELNTKVEKRTHELKVLNEKLIFEIKEKENIALTLRKSEENFRSLFDSTTDSIFVWGRDLKLLYANNEAYKFWGLDDEFIGKDIRNFGESALINQWIERITKVFSTKETLKVSDSGIRDNNTFYSESTIYPIMNFDNQVVSVGVIYRDVTEAKQNEIERNRLFVNSRDLLSVADFNGFLKQINPAWSNLLGWEEEELMKIPWFDFLHPDDLEYVREVMNKLNNNEHIVDYENRFECKEGGYKWLSWNALPIKEEGLIFAIGRDITEKKQTEEKLQKFSHTQSVLLKEVNHRVKNNLLALISILQKELVKARKIGILDFIEVLLDLELRIKSLSTVHTMLSASGWAPILISDLCRSVVHGALKGLVNTSDYNYDIEESTIKITSTQAHNLTIVFNELATNSIKHSGSKKDNIKITVTISEKDGKVFICYSDNGPGFPEEIVNGDLRKANIGVELIKGIVEHSLGGSVAFSNNPGAVTNISFELGDE